MKQELFVEITLYFLIGSAIIGSLIFIFRKIALKKYREKIKEFHWSIKSGRTKQINTYLLVNYDNGKIGFVKCFISHVYTNKDMANVIFKKNNLPYSKNTSKDVELKMIYPEWAVPSKHK